MRRISLFLSLFVSGGATVRFEPSAVSADCTGGKAKLTFTQAMGGKFIR